MTQNGGQNFGASSRALGAFDQRGPYGILIHLGVDFLKMNESQFQAENPAGKKLMPYSQQLLIIDLLWSTCYLMFWTSEMTTKNCLTSRSNRLLFAIYQS